MAHRPDPSEFDRPLTGTQLAELQRRFLLLSPSHVLEAYRRAHDACRMDVEGKMPRAADVQELVTAWKVLRAWKRKRPPRRD